MKYEERLLLQLLAMHLQHVLIGNVAVTGAGGMNFYCKRLLLSFLTYVFPNMVRMLH